MPPGEGAADRVAPAGTAEKKPRTRIVGAGNAFSNADAFAIVAAMRDHEFVEELRGIVADDIGAMFSIAASGNFEFLVAAGRLTKRGASRVALAFDEATLPLAVGAAFAYLDDHGYGRTITSAWLLSPTAQHIAEPLLARLQRTDGGVQ